MVVKARSLLLSLALLLVLGIAATFFAPSWFGERGSSPAPEETAERAPAPVVRTVTLEVAGMHCGGCVVMITQALEKTPGVVSAKVSLEEGKAEVALSTNDDIIVELVAAVADAGYTAAATDQ